MTLNLVRRLVKGTPLTAAEHDGNLDKLENAIEASPAGAREWTASTIEQAEAEAGTETTRRAFTAQRVRQAIAAWWTAASTAAGRAMAEAADAAAQRTLLGLATTDSPTFTGLTITGTAPVVIPHIHGSIAGEVYQHVRPDGVNLAALTPYHVVGSQGDTDRALVIAARGDTVAAMPASGILPAALSSNEDGHGTVAGVITGVNTAGLTSGDPVYVGLAGGLTATRPATGLVQVVAIVGRVHASTGSLAVAVGPALPPLAYTAAYGDLSGTPTVPSPADAAPQPLGATAAIGDSADYARENHVHQRDSDVIVIPVGDESTALTTGTSKIKFRMPFAATLLTVRASVGTAPTDSTLIVDINEAGTSVLGTKLSIDAGELTSTTAASAATITDPSLADDAEISIDVDQIGSTVAGAGLKVSMFVRRA
jgi:hypothetical protein